MIKRFVISIALVSAFFGAAIAVYARWIEPARLRVVRVPVMLPRDQGDLNGMTIAFVTDTHIGPNTSTDRLDHVAERLEAIEPDLVLFGGDFICESPRYIAPAVDGFGRIARTGRLGAYAVMGNHDLSNIRERVQEPLEAQGISFLTNAAASVPFGTTTLWIVGLDDVLLGKPDAEAAYKNVPPGAPSICLWHEGDLAEKAAPFGSFLQLSGHSHGGQVRFPGIGPIATPKLGRKYVRGLHRIDEMELYVSSGVGMYRPPVRLGCPPELTIVHLVA